VKNLRRTLLFAGVTLTNVGLVVAVVQHRRPLFRVTIEQAGAELPDNALDLAIATAMAVVTVGLVVAYAIARSLGRLLDKTARSRSSRLATWAVDATAAALNTAALMGPADFSGRNAALLPWPFLVAIPLLVWLLHRPTGRDPRRALQTLTTAAIASAATAVALGRWF